ncbi:putative RNA-directed DNA polymerase from transposon X-element [Nephila pilipes]|uniref:Putative RNA-directed DNA polymerase from transposon X-element n=1 Tax=Nephila pilipes TaxID=299642 RepID=A0A8X6PTY2_NEPPI|nr:putative RNA-directed DNA polymerase from transposon X-element [Nephila pilipes]
MRLALPLPFAQSTKSRFVHDLQEIFRNRSHCLMLGDFNAKHHTWSSTSRANSAGNSLFKFSQTFGVDILAPNDPTYYSNNQNYLPSTIDLGILKDLQNITIITSAELSSDDNQVCFLVGLDNLTPHTYNQILFTNWINFSDNLSQLICGNPLIKNLKRRLQILPSKFKIL